MRARSVAEIDKLYADVLNNPGLAAVCNWHKTIYANETPSPDSEEEYLQRAKENAGFLSPDRIEGMLKGI